MARPPALVPFALVLASLAGLVTSVPAAPAGPKSAASTGASAKPSVSGPAVVRAELTPAPEAVHPEYAACPRSVALGALDPEGLVGAIRRRCSNLRVPIGAAPTEIAPDDVLVAVCVRDKVAIDARQCGMKLQAVVVGDGGASTSVPLIPEGELMLALGVEKLAATTKLESGAPLTLAITTQTAGPNGLDIRSARSALVFHRPFNAYGSGRWLWLPMPMLTSDLSSSSRGYRLGITPIAVGAGTRWYPGASRAFVGASVFVGWNLLVPNDTQSLTNGTQVRVNYKAFGTGVLLDCAGWIGVGVGVGHTFTTDARTDFRTWLYLGPRTLKLLGDI
jgi:hypothetical protein